MGALRYGTVIWTSSKYTLPVQSAGSVGISGANRPSRITALRWLSPAGAVTETGNHSLYPRGVPFASVSPLSVVIRMPQYAALPNVSDLSDGSNIIHALTVIVLPTT